MEVEIEMEMEMGWIWGEGWGIWSMELEYGVWSMGISVYLLILTDIRNILKFSFNQFQIVDIQRLEVGFRYCRGRERF